LARNWQDGGKRILRLEKSIPKKRKGKKRLLKSGKGKREEATSALGEEKGKEASVKPGLEKRRVTKRGRETRG